MSIISNEMKRIAREEETLRRKAHRETFKWKAELESKVPDKVYETLRGVFRKAFELIFEKGTGIIEKTYRKENLSEDSLMRDYTLEIDSERGYRQMNARSELSSAAALLASTVEGVGLGALGIGLPDIVLFTSMLLRGCYETALRCGFDYDTPEERYLILTLLEGSILKGEAWDACSDRADALIASLHTPTEDELKTQIQQTADALAVDMLVSKFIQGIPIVGVAGGLANPLYYRKIQRYVRMKYQKRYLLSKKA